MLYLYTLELTEGKFYVGTTKNPDVRIASHYRGDGAAWTSAYPPLRVSREYPILELLGCRDEAACRLQEDAHVKAVMLAKGIAAVRGGSYSQRNLTRETVRVLSRELFHASNGCLRCGRHGHWARGCRAEVDVLGNVIGKGVKATGAAKVPNKPRRRGTKRGRGKGNGRGVVMVKGGWSTNCKRCGRTGHGHSQCQETTTAKGEPLSDDAFSTSSDEEEDDEGDESDGERGAAKGTVALAVGSAHDWPIVCYRCMRPGHLSTECYAQSTVHGDPL